MNETLARARQLAVSRLQHAQLQMQPELIEGPGSLFDLAQVLKDQDVRCAMVVTMPALVKDGAIGGFLNALLGQGITAAVFSDLKPQPDYECIERASSFYLSRNCDSIVAIGGGSTIDCAKAAGALVARPGKTPRELVGTMRIRKQLPLLVAVPTTAGTGSEVSATAILLDPDDKRMRTMRDFSLIPTFAVLDPTLLTSLSPQMTAYSGMAALSHAVEAYINRFGTLQTRRYARMAVETIFQHLKASYHDGKSLDDRHAMLMAAHWAGIASTNASLGYAHALSLSVCSHCNVQYGLASAVLLPMVLEEFGDRIEAQLADLGEAIGLEGATDSELARRFIGEIRALSTSMGIPAGISDLIDQDIPNVAAAADEEANPSFPVPIIWHYSTLQKVLRRAAKALPIPSGSETSSATRSNTEAMATDAPLSTSPSKPDQIEIASHGPLLDDEGRLTALGYAKSLVLDYSRKRIKASPLRIKEWDYYLVNDGEYALALTIGDMGYVALVSASLIDFKQGAFITQSTMDLLPLGKLGLPSSSSAGVTSYKDKRATMGFEVAEGLRRLSVSFSDFADGQTLEAEVVLDREPHDSMVIATPFAEDGSAFYYNQKIIGMRALGNLTLGDLRHDFHESSSFGLLDWGRGVWTRDNTWYWSAAQGLQGGHVFGFNLGYGFGDTSAASENMLFVDGTAHKLGRVDFGIPVKNERARAIGDLYDLMAPWHMTDDEGRLDLVFQPEIDRCDHMDFKVVVSDQHQVFGLFNGTVTLDDGTQLHISDLRGFAEAVHNVY